MTDKTTKEPVLIDMWLAAQTASAQITLSCAKTITGLCHAAAGIAALAAENGIAQAQLGGLTGTHNEDGDQQKALDVLADELIAQHMRGTGIYAYLSEERDGPLIMDEGGALVLACDPLDGSSNIDTNLTIGTIFSVYPADSADCLAAGRSQQAAGFFAYGPQTALLITTGHGVAAFCLNDRGVFQQMDWQVQIPAETGEFAINAANSRYWSPAVSNYIDQLLAGKDGPRTRNFNMRWNGSLVADAFRIFRRGGIFLYPQDSRRGYEQGRLRLVYEANPIAFLAEQAGGRATDGTQPILDIRPLTVHQRVPLIFGSADEVDTAASQL